MNEKLPAPCQACHASGLRDGSECRECGGKGYRLFINGNQIPIQPQRRQRQRPMQRQQHPVR